MYVVMLPQGILDDPANQGAGHHYLWPMDLVNKWNVTTGGGGGGGTGGGQGFSDVYNTMIGWSFATQYWDLNGTMTRAGEQFDTGSGDIRKASTQIALVLKKTGSPTGTKKRIGRYNCCYDRGSRRQHYSNDGLNRDLHEHG